MAYTGYIDWHRLGRTRPWTDTRQGNTFVYAYWTADHGYSEHDRGVGLLKPRAQHPDWFLYAEQADKILFSALPDGLVASPNLTQVYDTHLTARPLLGSILLGTVQTTYAYPDQSAYWWASGNDLTRPGRRLLKQLSMLYLRPPIIVTFLEIKPMKQVVPGAAGDKATSPEAPGHDPSPGVVDAGDKSSR